MVRRGLAPSRARAAELIANGDVLVSGSVADRASRMVDSGEPVVLLEAGPSYVSRGGEKLAGALDRFDIQVDGVLALDAGASTGGFTDCLLQNGASEVVAVDVGRGQLHERLREDARVVVLEKTNVRTVSPASLGRTFDIVTADLSFISLRTVSAGLVDLVRPGGDLVVLVKPQFEVGRREATKGKGVVRDPGLWRSALQGVIAAFEQAGAAMMGIMVSPLRGADGNVEFLAHFRVAARPGGGDTAQSQENPGGPLTPAPERDQPEEDQIESAIAAGVSLSLSGPKARP